MLLIRDNMRSLKISLLSYPWEEEDARASTKLTTLRMPSKSQKTDVIRENGWKTKWAPKPGALALYTTIMSSLDFETTVKQEEDYLRKVHPTSEDIPSCMKLFDLFLQCNGTSLDPPKPTRSLYSCSCCCPDEVIVQVRPDGRVWTEAWRLQVLHE